MTTRRAFFSFLAGAAASPVVAALPAIAAPARPMTMTGLVMLNEPPIRLETIASRDLLREAFIKVNSNFPELQRTLDCELLPNFDGSLARRV